MFDYNYDERLVKTSSHQTEKQNSVLWVIFGNGQKLNYYDDNSKIRSRSASTRSGRHFVFEQRPSPAEKDYKDAKQIFYLNIKMDLIEYIQ